MVSFTCMVRFRACRSVLACKWYLYLITIKDNRKCLIQKKKPTTKKPKQKQNLAMSKFCELHIK